MILLTGHTGFLGKQIGKSLTDDGRQVVGLGRSKQSDIQCDLSLSVPDFSALKEKLNIQTSVKNAVDFSLSGIDLVIHAAGLAHRVPKTEVERKAFFQVNVEGTRNLLEGLLRASMIPKQFLFVSTIALYGDPMDELKSVPPYPSRSEAESLNLSPYGWSKWESEQLVREWCDKNGCNCLIWRLPLIVGEDAPGNLGAMEKAIKRGYYFRIGNSYQRFRYFVNMSDLQSMVINLIGNEQGTINVFSGKKSYGEFEDEFAAKYGKSIKTMPVSLVRYLAKFGDFIPGFPLNSYRLNKLLGE